MYPEPYVPRRGMAEREEITSKQPVFDKFYKQLSMLPRQENDRPAPMLELFQIPAQDAERGNDPPIDQVPAVPLNRVSFGAVPPNRRVSFGLGRGQVVSANVSEDESMSEQATAEALMNTKSNLTVSEDRSRSEQATADALTDTKSDLTQTPTTLRVNLLDKYRNALSSVLSIVDADCAFTISEIIDLPPMSGRPTPVTPRSDNEALNGPDRDKWAKAYEYEREGVRASRTWEEVFDYRGKTVDSMWVYRVSLEQDGTWKFRARIVGKGFTQIFGFNFFDSSSPVIATKTLLMLLHIAASLGWFIRNLDVGNAYLESDIDVDLYLKLPKTEWVNGKPKIVKLLKGLYGLKQSGKLWNKLLHKVLVSFDFERTYSDPCLYFRYNSSGKMLVGVYVDDILYCGDNLDILTAFEQDMIANFRKISLLGDVQKFVGLRISRDLEKRTITVTQPDYILNMVESEGLTGAPIKKTPASPSIDLLRVAPGTHEAMRSVVGKLRYPADRSQPGSLFALSRLGSTQLFPADEHIKAAKRVVQYMAGRVNEGITLGGFAPIRLETWVDASHIEEGAARSQLGIGCRLGPEAGFFLSRSIYDTWVSFSSAESELRGFAYGIFESMWARFLLEEIGFKQEEETELITDNEAVVTLVTSLASPSSRTKHVNKLKKIITQAIDRKEVKALWKEGSENTADLYTKNLDLFKFEKFNHDATGGKLRG